MKAKELILVILSTLAVALSAQAAMDKPPVLVVGGSFVMGEGGTLANGDLPTHRVTVHSFYICPTELTFGRFGEFVATTGYQTSCERDGRGAFILSNNNDIFVRKAEMNWRHSTYPQSAEQPVASVSWLDAVHYANWLSQHDGLKPVYQIEGDQVKWDRTANGWRLPTEAEWEYAAKGGQLSHGFRHAGSNNFYEVAWSAEDARQTTHPVGGKKPNELGLYDMIGNVYEWCWDWYGPYQSADQVDPVGPDMGLFHVLRGGSWNSGPNPNTEPITNTFRAFDQASRAFNTYGFRLVRNAAEPVS